MYVCARKSACPPPGMVVATALNITHRVTKAIWQDQDNKRAERRLAEVGGHDPGVPMCGLKPRRRADLPRSSLVACRGTENKIMHSGWLHKQAVSGTVLRNWKRRCVAVATNICKQARARGPERTQTGSRPRPYRYIVVRRDRIEYHRGVPQKQPTPRVGEGPPPCITRTPDGPPPVVPPSAPLPLISPGAPPEST